MTGIQFGPYRLLEEIGSGAMAKVYRAIFTGPEHFSREVAIKIIHHDIASLATYAQAFKGEARLGGYLSHPNLVQTLNFGEEQGQLYLAMEYVRGATLRQVISRCRANHQRLSPQLVLELVLQICHGLAYAHEATDHDGNPLKIIHRDLKPSNILISTHGQVKIGDFGVARAESNLNQTVLGSSIIKGTLSYMSPEQALARVDLDARSDVFAVGLLLYELLTLSPMYTGSSDLMVLRRAQDADVAAALAGLPDMPARESFRTILARALAANPEDRFSSAQQLGNALVKMQSILNWEGPFPALIQQHALYSDAGTSASDSDDDLDWLVSNERLQLAAVSGDCVLRALPGKPAAAAQVVESGPPIQKTVAPYYWVLILVTIGLLSTIAGVWSRGGLRAAPSEAKPNPMGAADKVLLGEASSPGAVMATPISVYAAHMVSPVPETGSSGTPSPLPVGAEGATQKSGKEIVIRIRSNKDKEPEPPQHEPRRPGKGGAPRGSVTPPPEPVTPTPLPVVEKAGWLSLSGAEAAEAFLDNVPLGKLPVYQKPVAAGTHQVRIQLSSGESWTGAVSIPSETSISCRLLSTLEIQGCRSINRSTGGKL